MLGSCSLVEIMTWRSCYKCPLCIASEKQICFLTWEEVIFPGRECRSPALMELQRVDISGEMRVAWKKAMRLARCSSGHRALAAWDGASADDKFIVVCGSAACEKISLWMRHNTGRLEI